jgi:hypothetical protein
MAGVVNKLVRWRRVRRWCGIAGVVALWVWGFSLSWAVVLQTRRLYEYGVAGGAVFYTAGHPDNAGSWDVNVYRTEYGPVWIATTHMVAGHDDPVTKLPTTRVHHASVAFYPLPVVLLAAAGVAHVQVRRRRPHLCASCLYDLRATPAGGVCPECGLRSALGDGAGGGRGG